MKLEDRTLERTFASSESRVRHVVEVPRAAVPAVQRFVARWTEKRGP